MVTSPDVTLNDFMKYCDWSSKLEKILEQTDKETLYDFIRSYAETNQDLALALIEQFDRKDSDDAKAMVESVTMTYEEYISDLTRKITSSYGAFRWDYAEKLVRYLLKHDELDEAHKAAQTYDSGGKAMVLLIDYLTEHQLYDEAIETNLEVKDTFTRYSNKLDEKLVDVLRRQGDKNKLIDTCRLRFLEAEYRWTYYEALKEAVPSKEWSSFLQHLLSDCDFHMDCDETQLRLYRAEKLYDKFFPYFMKNNYVEVERWAQYGGLMTEEEQLQVADKLSDSIVEMAKRQNKRRDYRFVAEHVATFMKASPIAMKKGQELISRIMNAVPGRPALYDELMKI